jgi:hypothetical protein
LLDRQIGNNQFNLQISRDLSGSGKNPARIVSDVIQSYPEAEIVRVYSALQPNQSFKNYADVIRFEEDRITKMMLGTTKCPREIIQLATQVREQLKAKNLAQAWMIFKRLLGLVRGSKQITDLIGLDQLEATWGEQVKRFDSYFGVK